VIEPAKRSSHTHRRSAPMPTTRLIPHDPAWPAGCSQTRELAAFV